jgi:hypothetical protein
MTSLTNLNPAGGHTILGCPGPLLSGGMHLAYGVQSAVAQRHRGRRDRPVRLLRAAMRKALPWATIVVDHFHLLRLANDTLMAVHRPVTRNDRECPAARSIRSGLSGACSPPANGSVTTVRRDVERLRGRRTPRPDSRRWITKNNL